MYVTSQHTEQRQLYVKSKHTEERNVSKSLEPARIIDLQSFFARERGLSLPVGGLRGWFSPDLSLPVADEIRCWFKIHGGPEESGVFWEVPLRGSQLPRAEYS